MGNDLSRQEERATGAGQLQEKLELVRDEAGKLFALDLARESSKGLLGAEEASYCSSHSNRTSNRHHIQSILDNSLLHKEEDGDSDSTRDTCDSPLFAKRSNSSRSSARSNHNSHKIRPGSLVSHLVHPRRHPSASAAAATTKSSHPSLKKKNDSLSQSHHNPLMFPQLSGDAGSSSSRAIKIPRANPRHRPRVVDQDEYEEESQHLKQLYDSRTWEMFHRITEARNKNPQNNASVCSNASISHVLATGATDPSSQAFGYGGIMVSTQDQHHNNNLQDSLEEQEMPFGDLDDE